MDVKTFPVNRVIDFITWRYFLSHMINAFFFRLDFEFVFFLQDHYSSMTIPSYRQMQQGKYSD